MCNHDIKDLIGTKDGIMCRVCGKILKPEEIGKPAKEEALPFAEEPEEPEAVEEEPAQEEKPAKAKKPAKKPAKSGRKAAK